MSVSSISGNSVWTQMQQFKAGKVNLQKSDLEKIQQQAAQEQSQTQSSQSANPFDALLAAFDEIDQDQNGISIDELKSYASENGMTAGGPGQGGRPEGPPLGPPPGPPPSMMSELGQANGAGGPPESVSKDELLEIQSQMEAEGMEVPEQLSQMISNFDSLDTNQDGKVSIEEMMASQETEGTSETDAADGKKLDLLKLIEQYAQEYSAETSSDSSSDVSQDMAIRFMRAMNEYSRFTANSAQNMNSSLFEIDA